jgi:type IX secretion system PorP/SprF family membrane protein
MLTRKLRQLIIVSVIICNFSLYSQERSIFFNSYTTPFITNAACTGSEYYPVVKISVQKTLMEFPDAPATYLMYGNIRLGQRQFYNSKYFLNKGAVKYSDRIGLGVAIYHDKNGPLTNTGGIISYAYHIPVNRDDHLSLGLSMLFANYSCNTAILQPGQTNDNYLLEGNDSKYNINFGFGIYYRANKYFGGISINKFLPDRSNASEPNTLQPSFFVLGGYKFNTDNDNLIFEPSMEVKKLHSEKLYVEVHNKLYIKKLNWVAISVSSSRIFNFQLAVRIHNMTYIGYNYGYSLNPIAGANYGIHELSVGMNIGLTGIEGIQKNYQM